MGRVSHRVHQDAPPQAWLNGRILMGDKSPKKPNDKKVGKSLKEKRLDKNAKREGKKAY